MVSFPVRFIVEVLVTCLYIGSVHKTAIHEQKFQFLVMAFWLDASWNWLQFRLRHALDLVQQHPPAPSTNYVFHYALFTSFKWNALEETLHKRCECSVSRPPLSSDKGSLAFRDLWKVSVSSRWLMGLCRFRCPNYFPNLTNISSNSVRWFPSRGSVYAVHCCYRGWLIPCATADF